MSFALRLGVCAMWCWRITCGVAESGPGHGTASRRGAAFVSGCFDLLGNVSEWLESADRFENENARHIGGHAQDRLEAIFTVPVRDAPRSGRNRMTGFRVVMAVGEVQAPGLVATEPVGSHSLLMDDPDERRQRADAQVAANRARLLSGR